MCPITANPESTSQTNGHARRIDVASIRREQIIEAAVGIIVEQGLHNLSLSKIEQRAGMKRGQLTYYFPTKEDILLAVFDRLLLLMFQRMGQKFSCGEGTIGVPSAWEMFCDRLPRVLSPEKIGQEFHALQFTFLAQIGHRDDFRKRLASLFSDWRNGLAAHWQVTANPELELARHVSPKTISSFIQALFHGLGMQLAADPEAFDRQEMLQFCIGMLAPLFVCRPETSSSTQRSTNGSKAKSKRTPEKPS